MLGSQAIQDDGHVVALVAGGRALNDDGLTGAALARVRAKCLYALEIQAGTRPGPYADESAGRSAEHALRDRPPARVSRARRCA